jgi:hypothetical protein
MVMVLEKFRLSKFDALQMHGGGRGEGWCPRSGYVGSLIRLSAERRTTGEARERGAHVKIKKALCIPQVDELQFGFEMVARMWGGTSRSNHGRAEDAQESRAV